MSTEDTQLDKELNRLYELAFHVVPTEGDSGAEKVFDTLKNTHYFGNLSPWGYFDIFQTIQKKDRLRLNFAFDASPCFARADRSWGDSGKFPISLQD